MEFDGSNSYLYKAKQYIDKLESIKSPITEVEDDLIEECGIAATMYAIVSIAESLDVLSKRNFKI